MEELDKNELEENSISITLTQLKKFCNNCSKVYEFTDDDDVQVSFELIIGSLFPTILDNIKIFGTKKYIQGYTQGLEDAKNENKGNNGRVLH